MGYLTRGKKKEKEFAKLIGNVIRFANTEEDMFGHWDVEIFYNNGNKKFDIKGVRKVERSDSAENEVYHWIEIKNVNGNLGWLYGDADYFAFEMFYQWVIVEKIKLQNLIKEKTIKERVYKPEIYRIYHRKGKSDILVLVRTKDLIEISDKIIKK